MSFSSTDPNCTVCHAKPVAVVCCTQAAVRWCIDCVPKGDGPHCRCHEEQAQYVRVREPRVGELALLTTHSNGDQLSTQLTADSVAHLLEALRTSAEPRANALAKAITSMLG